MITWEWQHYLNLSLSWCKRSETVWVGSLSSMGLDRVGGGKRHLLGFKEESCRLGTWKWFAYCTTEMAICTGMHLGVPGTFCSCLLVCSKNISEHVICANSAAWGAAPTKKIRKSVAHSKRVCFQVLRASLFFVFYPGIENIFQCVWMFLCFYPWSESIFRCVLEQRRDPTSPFVGLFPSLFFTKHFPGTSMIFNRMFKLPPMSLVVKQMAWPVWKVSVAGQ